MTPVQTVLHLHDLDLLLRELQDADALACFKRLGLPIGPLAPLEAARREAAARVEPRWRHHYDRAQRRYGGAVAAVRGRTCQGCHMTLPRSAAPAAGEMLALCESCGRILYWGVRAGA
jgi:hypothetical protein